MKNLNAFGVLGVLLLVPVCGCGKVGPPTPSNPTIPTISATTSTDQPTIKIANWEETQQLVAQNPGKVVILDLWATW
jgi:thiol:disulfide interchange protein